MMDLSLLIWVMNEIPRWREAWLAAWLSWRVEACEGVGFGWDGWAPAKNRVCWVGIWRAEGPGFVDDWMDCCCCSSCLLSSWSWGTCTRIFTPLVARLIIVGNDANPHWIYQNVETPATIIHIIHSFLCKLDHLISKVAIHILLPLRFVKPYRCSTNAHV